MGRKKKLKIDDRESTYQEQYSRTVIDELRNGSAQHQELWDDLDWVRVSDEYPWKLAKSLRDYLIDDKNCPAPLRIWFANSVDEANGDTKKLLQSLGFLAGTKRPKAGSRWTKRMVRKIRDSKEINPSTEGEAILELEATASIMGYSLSESHIKELIGKKRKR